jgi:hypothetical protein
MDKTGKNYENFVAELQQAILRSEGFGIQRNIVIEKNKIIKDNNGIKREFDLYWEYELGGLTYKTVIECKDYNSKIKIDKIDAFIGKTNDIPGLSLAFATKCGYQSGAGIKAKQHGIELLIVREQNDSDWVDEYGNPLLQIIHVTGHLIIPARITSFLPMFEGKWIKENRPDIDMTRPVHLHGLNNEIFIDDIYNNEKYSLYELAQKLTALEDNKPGNYERSKQFSDAYLQYRDEKLKLHSYKVVYSIPEPIESIIHVDFSQELLGVIEYINKGIKMKIFGNGNIQQNKLID